MFMNVLMASWGFRKAGTSFLCRVLLASWHLGSSPIRQTKMFFLVCLDESMIMLAKQIGSVKPVGAYITSRLLVEGSFMQVCITFWYLSGGASSRRSMG